MGHVHHRLQFGGAVGLQGTGRVRAAHRRHRIADVDLAAGNVERASVERDLPGKAGDAVFGGGIGRQAGARGMCRDRAVVDDAPAPRHLRLHLDEGGAGDVESAAEVHVDDFAPVGGGDLVNRGGGHVGTGVVEDYVDAAKSGGDAGECGIDGGGVGDIARHGDSVGVIGGGFSQGFGSSANKGNVIAIGEEGLRTGTANAGARSSDDSDFGHGQSFPCGFASAALA